MLLWLFTAYASCIDIGFPSVLASEHSQHRFTQNDSRLSEKVLDTVTEREFCVLRSTEFRDRLMRNRAAIKEYSGLLAEKESEILETDLESHAKKLVEITEGKPKLISKILSSPYMKIPE